MAVKIRERPKGSGQWWVFINHQGKRKAKKIGRDKRLAQEVAKKIEAKLLLNDVGLLQDDKKADTFKRYAETWQITTLPATCKKSTAEDYERILKNHILPIFGEISVAEITRSMVKQLLFKKVAKGYSPSTVTHIKNAISGVLNLAIDDETISINPAHKLGKIFKTQDRKLKTDPLTRQEVKILLDTLKQHYQWYHPIALTFARTGLRLGEALGLQWGDIDLNGGFLMVRRNISRNRIETPKSGKIRRVDMSKQLSFNLKQLKHDRKIERLKRGWEKVSEWVFLNQDGERLESWRFQRVFNAALDKAELRKVRVHDLRHAYASALIQDGESLAYVRDQLGHHSIKLTVDVYGHLVPGANREAVDKLDDPDFQRNKTQPIRSQKIKRT